MSNDPFKPHPNSHVVTIFRAGSFLSRVQGPEMEDYFETAKQTIGSYWEEPNSAKVGSGLDYWEQDLLLPFLINCESNDRGFRLAVEGFYHEIDTKVPHKLGVKLEIGLKDSNDKPLSEKNLPLNISDYIKWRHHRGHPQVAGSRQEAEGNSLKRYYIFDPLEAQIKQTKKSKERDEALQIYLTIKKEPEKIDWMLTLLEIDPRSFGGTSEVKLDLKLEKLHDLAQSQPDRFRLVYGSENLGTRYIIEKMVTVGVLLKLGTKYINSQDKSTIGHNMEEALSYFMDDENQQQIALLMAHMQEAEKKPLIQGQKQTVLTDKQRYGGTAPSTRR